jgi:hypothetical protein
MTSDFLILQQTNIGFHFVTRNYETLPESLHQVAAQVSLVGGSFTSAVYIEQPQGCFNTPSLSWQTDDHRGNMPTFSLEYMVPISAGLAACLWFLSASPRGCHEVFRLSPATSLPIHHSSLSSGLFRHYITPAGKSALLSILRINICHQKYNVECRTIARQLLDKHIPAGANAPNSRTSIARQRISKHASLTTDAVFSAWSVESCYKEVFDSTESTQEVKSRVSGLQSAGI